jgi:[ribosomal protein S18]-alanine N-acetyltransferase
MPHFRALTENDEAACVQIWQELEGHYDHPIGGSWTPEKIKNEIAESESLAAVNDQGELEAYCLYRKSADQLEIMLLVTRPRWHRSGAMRALVRALTDDLSADSRIWLEVHAGNIPAISLYESLGFSLVGERANYYADGGKAFLYEYKPLQ